MNKLILGFLLFLPLVVSAQEVEVLVGINTSHYFVENPENLNEDNENFAFQTENLFIAKSVNSYNNPSIAFGGRFELQLGSGFAIGGYGGFVTGYCLEMLDKDASREEIDNCNPVMLPFVAPALSYTYHFEDSPWSAGASVIQFQAATVTALKLGYEF